MKKTKQPKLKPCPFCGKPAGIMKLRGSKTWQIGCIDKNGIRFSCALWPFTICDSKSSAISAWNKRA